jgi:hypothetical protein
VKSFPGSYNQIFFNIMARNPLACNDKNESILIHTYMCSTFQICVQSLWKVWIISCTFYRLHKLGTLYCLQWQKQQYNIELCEHFQIFPLWISNVTISVHNVKEYLRYNLLFTLSIVIAHKFGRCYTYMYGLKYFHFCHCMPEGS